MDNKVASKGVSTISQFLQPHNIRKNGKRRSSYLSMTVSAIQTSVSKLDCSSKRVVFLDLNGFYECWRILPSDVLFDAMLILPNVYTEWILRPMGFLHIPAQIDAVLSDQVFLKMLQWKHEQGLVFCMLNTAQTMSSWKLPSNEDDKHRIAPFWRYLSRQLCQLQDPLTFKTSTYNPLIFDAAYYTSPQFASCFHVQPAALLAALQTMQMPSKALTMKILRELLHQSNPSLFVVESYEEISGKGDNTYTDTRYTLSDEVLDELSADVAYEQLQDADEVHICSVKLTGLKAQTVQTPYDPITPFYTRDQEKKFDEELEDILNGVDDDWCGANDDQSNDCHLLQMDLASTNNLGGLDMSDSAVSPTLIMLDSAEEEQEQEEEEEATTISSVKKRDSVLTSNDWWVSDDYYTNFETPELSGIEEEGGD